MDPLGSGVKGTCLGMVRTLWGVWASRNDTGEESGLKGIIVVP